MNSVLEQATTMLDKKGVKYSADYDLGRVWASYRSDSIPYIVEIVHDNNKENYYKILAKMPFAVQKIRIPLLSVYFCERNRQLRYSNYKMDLKTGRITLEYGFLVDDKEMTIPETTLWTYYYSVSHIAGTDIKRVSNIACGDLSREDIEAFKEYFPDLQRVSQARVGSEQKEKTDLVEEVNSVMKENVNVLRYFAKGGLCQK